MKKECDQKLGDKAVAWYRNLNRYTLGLDPVGDTYTKTVDLLKKQYDFDVIPKIAKIEAKNKPIGKATIGADITWDTGFETVASVEGANTFLGTYEKFELKMKPGEVITKLTTRGN